jgi:hypothetical protein
MQRFETYEAVTLPGVLCGLWVGVAATSARSSTGTESEPNRLQPQDLHRVGESEAVNVRYVVGPIPL